MAAVHDSGPGGAAKGPARSEDKGVRSGPKLLGQREPAG